MISTILIFLAVLALLVLAHEAGHFFVAKKIGAKVEEFGFGFPPRLFYFKRGQTVYSINALPLGGFVRIKGENGDYGADADSFASKSPIRKIFVMAAGVAMNMILAFVLLSVGFATGIPQVVSDSMPSYARVEQERITVAHVEPDSPVSKAGIGAGEHILAIDGNKFKSIQEIQAYLQTKQDKAVEVQTLRAGRETTTSVLPELSEDGNRVIMGASLLETGVVSYPVYRAVLYGATSTVNMTGMFIASFADIIKSAFGEKKTAVEVAGPLGIAVMTGEMARLGMPYLLQFAAALSINLAIINFIPFPALDGGRAMFVLLERFRGRPVSRNLENAIHTTGFAFLMLLVAFVTYRDLARFGGQIVGGLRNLFGI
ncbi:MAG: membrane-associated zinc metalloprotease [uncultured bacterium]|nr:MAG: membrane-associated zinc metalloprotease [uncultured bacterium]HBD05455.1 RIP metalloprotease RseP [Candidatus Uhrbacteria bacterium]